ncbi:Transcription factor RAX1 [Cardamine amara subsp. amara]|uniref:Transcription factor RAX1 n=1 Tax=Cardamine amara subsp. amara TaxID=228776 RepID=A0ABD1BHW9_CARAN
MSSPFINPNSQDVKRPLTPSTTIPFSSFNPYAENPNEDPTKSLISSINVFEADCKQIFPYINPNYPQNHSLSDGNNNISGTSGFLLNHNICDHYNNHNSFTSDVNGKRSEIMMKQEEIMMMMMIDHHIDQRTKGFNGDFSQGYYNYYNGHGDLKQMISGTGTNSNINMGGSGSSSSSISNLAGNKSSNSLLQQKCLPYFYS